MRISSIDALLGREESQTWIAAHGRPAVVDALRQAAAEVRAGQAGDPGGHPGKGPGQAPDNSNDARVMTLAARRLDARAQSTLRTVINATGVILHTNLGRAPLSRAALDRMAAAGAGYASVEYDLAAGARGRRDTHAEPLLRELTGAEAAVAVNNNAAGALLTLTALAAGREVIVSRGELVEIGGGFGDAEITAPL